MNGKMIFILLSPIWGIVEEFKEKFEHLVHETWPWMCGWIGFKFYKTQTKSENHKICHDIIQGCDKKLRRFHKSCHVRYLQDEAISEEVP